MSTGPQSICMFQVMDLVVRMGYDDVYLIGFDGFSNLGNQGHTKVHHYFWEDPDLYPEQSAAWNMANRVAAQVRGRPETGWQVNTGGHLFQEKTEGKQTHGNNGYEQALLAFAAFNRIRIINLNPNSTLATFVFTETIDQALERLG